MSSYRLVKSDQLELFLISFGSHLVFIIFFCFEIIAKMQFNLSRIIDNLLNIEPAINILESSISNQIKSTLALYSLFYAEVCHELAAPISVPLRPGKKATFEETIQRLQAVGNFESDFNGPRFELQIWRYRLTNWPVSLYKHKINFCLFACFWSND